MIHTHYLPIVNGIWTPLTSTLGGPVFWQFLPPIVATWMRVDGARAVQVRDYTRVRGTSLELYTLCEFYQSIVAGESWAMTVVEYGDEQEYNARETFYDSMYSEVAHATGCPCATNLSWAPAGWCLELEVIAYGGNNDGAPAARIDLRSIDSTLLETFFIATPGIRHIRRPCTYVAIERFDWTGGAVLPTIDCYGWLRIQSVGIT